MTHTTTAPTAPTRDHHAAVALGDEARRRIQEEYRAIIPPESAPHLLIEGTVSGIFLDVTMPTGERWRYRHAIEATEGKTLLVHIELARPCVARLFTPTAEGLHPFAGEALRFGVERSVA